MPRLIGPAAHLAAFATLLPLVNLVDGDRVVEWIAIYDLENREI